MGHSVDDIDKVHWYLKGLGADFANISTAQMSLTPLPAFKDLVPKAKIFEIFQKSLGSSSPVSSLPAIDSNLIFDNLVSITKCLARTLLPKMVELSANIVM